MRGARSYNVSCILGSFMHLRAQTSEHPANLADSYVKTLVINISYESKIMRKKQLILHFDRRSLRNSEKPKKFPISSPS